MLNSGLIGTILCFEYNICVRTGCLCCINYVSKLTGKSSGDSIQFYNQLKSGKNLPLPGVVRVSFAMYNTEYDVTYCFEAVKNVLEGKVKNKYRKQTDGSYVPNDENNLNECVCKKYDKLLKDTVEGIN